jgi:hypothetical protein
MGRSRGHLDGTPGTGMGWSWSPRRAHRQPGPEARNPFSAVRACSSSPRVRRSGERQDGVSDLARRTMARPDVLEEMDMLTRLHRDGPCRTSTPRAPLLEGSKSAGLGLPNLDNRIGAYGWATARRAPGGEGFQGQDRAGPDAQGRRHHGRGHRRACGDRPGLVPARSWPLARVPADIRKKAWREYQTR